LGVRDIMGYCVTALIITMPIFVIGLFPTAGTGTPRAGTSQAGKQQRS
jgi:hypothetical protein